MGRAGRRARHRAVRNGATAAVAADPITDANVRRALNCAVNRQELVDKILFGCGSVGNDVPIGRGQRFFNSEMPRTEHDPDKVKVSPRKAGLDSLEVGLPSSDAAVLYQSSAKPGGIDIDVARAPNDGHWSDGWMRKPFSAVSWSDRPVEDAMPTNAFSSWAAWNDTFWDNARFTELPGTARSARDEAKRCEMDSEMQLNLNADGGAIFPMFANRVIVAGNTVATGNEEPASNWDRDGEHWTERWSFARPGARAGADLARVRHGRKALVKRLSSGLLKAVPARPDRWAMPWSTGARPCPARSRPASRGRDGTSPPGVLG